MNYCATIQHEIDLKPLAVEMMVASKTPEQLASTIVDMQRHIESLEKRIKTDSAEKNALYARLESQEAFSSAVIDAVNRQLGRI